MRLLRGFCVLACLNIAALHAQSFNYTFSAQPTSVAAGQDGNLYIVLPSGAFGVLTPAGTYTQIATLSGAPTLCLEMTNGNFLGFLSTEVVTVSVSGQVTNLGALDLDANDYVCPIAASDGNYYGGWAYGGTYSQGFLYKVTSAGVLTTVYNFTGNSDGRGPQYQLVQASDGNLYGFSLSDYFRYNTSSGVVVLNNSLNELSAAGSLLEGSDGNLYGQGVSNDQIVLARFSASGGFTALAQIGNIQTYTMGGSGNIFAIGNYDEDPRDYCDTSLLTTGYSITGEVINSGTSVGPIGYELSGTFNPAGLGAYYGSLTETSAEYNDEYQLCQTIQTAYAVTTLDFDTVPNVSVALNQTHVLPGKSATLTWAVNGAYSLDRQQCYAYINGHAAGKSALSGSMTVTQPTAGSSTYALQCGGTLTNSATLTAGNAQLVFQPSLTTTIPGQPITLTGTITNVETPAPTGKVSFYFGSTLLASAALNSSGVAALNVSTNGVAPGSYSITAKYPGDSNYGPATSTAVTVTVVAPAATTLALSTTTPTIQDGQTANFTATATGSAKYDPSGSVAFYTGTTEIGSAAFTSFGTNTSTATFKPVVASIPAGTYSIVAKYAGDGWNGAATSNAVSLQVTPDGVSLTASPNPVPASTAFTLTATVKSTGTAPTGSVLFYAGSTQIGSASLTNGSASATFQSGTLAAGTYSVTAYYAGDKNNPAVTSPSVSLVVD